MLETDGLVEIGQREEILPAVPQRHAAAVIGVRKLGIEKERAGEILDGARILVELLVGQAAVVERQCTELGRHGIDPHGGGIVVDRATVFVQALEGKTWNNLALSGNRLLIRNGEEAACYELPVRKP